MTAEPELLPCGECGMPCRAGEYHPFAACLMFKACHNSETVRANLAPLQAENERLRAEVAHAVAGMNAALDKVIEHRNARHDAEARAERLAEALRPFAALYQPDDIGHMSNDQPDSQGIYGVNGKAITLGDLRRAASALAQEDRNGSPAKS